MKESNTLEDNVVIRQLSRDIFLSIKGLCMKESNTLADLVVISQHLMKVFLSIKGKRAVHGMSQISLWTMWLSHNSKGTYC